MKLAIVHDWLNQIGGAEDVLDTLMDMYANSPLFTSIYWRDEMPSHYRKWDIRTLWIDKLPRIHQKHQLYFPIFPLAWAGVNLSEYDVVLSNKSGFCHFLRTDGIHICYCLTPTRYVWQYDAYMERENVPAAIRVTLRPLIELLRGLDYRAAQRVDHFIAISTEIQQRIRTYYNRDSIVIFPPVQVRERFQPVSIHDDYFLSLGRIIPYKRIDLLVEACTRLNLPLKVGGTGRDLDSLKAIAGPTVEFLGYVPDEELPELFARAKAFVFPGYEDFGITPVQAQAAGRPVIAYKAGGSLDTIIEGKTGMFFEEQTVESLMAALQKFNADDYDPADCRENALRFDESVFRQQISDYVAQIWSNGQQ